jgi:low-affinity ferrous iron transport protein
MTCIVKAIRAAGAKGEIADAAPTQLVNFNTVPATENSQKPKKSLADTPGSTIPPGNITGFVPKAKDRLLDRWLDTVVRLSGSELVFLAIVTGIVIWAFLGIRFGGSVQWAVIISDVQAIICYIFDSFLMRQQLNEYESNVRVAAMLRSRNKSHKRMLRAILGSRHYGMLTQAQLDELHMDKPESELPAENVVTRITTFLSAVLGHIVTCGLYWVCIFIWIGFGQYCGWSEEWLLHINSSTSALMLLIFVFLANIQERHGAHTDKCLDTLFQVDSAIETDLRTITRDTIPNPVVTIPPPKVSRIQRAIFYYADVVGTLVGIAILITVMIAWVAVGPIMSFNSNWWLIIGTYAGLIGMNDGFVLDNVQSRLHSYVDDALEQIRLDDVSLLDDIGAPEQDDEPDRRLTMSQRLSMKVAAVCSHPGTVVLGVLCIFGLIIGASAMKWTTTAQLLCNIPPSIIETFFMMILITGHKLSDDKRREDLRIMYLRRLKVLSWVKGLKLLEVG